MDTQIKYLQENVKLESYAQSENFIGFSEEKKLAHEELAASIFLSFAKQNSNFFIISSLNKNLLIEGLPQDSLSKIKSLKKDKWITDSKNGDLLNLRQFSFSLKKEYESLKDCILLVLKGYTYGHIFFVWPQKGLFIYPHEDGGFGAISDKSGRGRTEGENFLHLFSKYSSFDLHIEKEE